MDYFANDAEAVHVSGMAIENGLGQVVIHGTMLIEPGEQAATMIDRLIGELVLLRDAAVADVKRAKKEEEMPLPLKVIDNPFG